MTTVSTLKINLDANSASFDSDLKKAENRLKSFSRHAKSANDANGGMSRSFRSAAQSVAAFEGPLSGVSGRLNAMGGLVSSTTIAWGAFGAAVAGVSYTMVKAATAFAEMERQQLRTEALLKATGNAVGFTAGELDKMARSVALNTLASTEEVRDAQSVLMTFKSVSRETFTEAIGLSQDMATVFGGDAKTAALQLGKALEEPTKGISALRRSGVSFTESQKEMIRSMEDTGRVADAQQIILDQLKDQVGGAAASEAGGLAGSADTLGQRWEELLESLGKTRVIGGTAQAALDGLSSAMKGMKEAIDPDPQNQLEQKLKRLAEVRKQLEEDNKPKPASQNTYVGGLMNTKPATSGYSYLAANSGSQNDLKKEESQLVSHIENLKGIIKQEDIEKEKARDQAEAARLQREEEARQARERKAEQEAAKKLELQQNAGARLITSLDSYLADEQGRINLAYETRRQQIEEMQLTEEEVTRRGYENLEALKDEYLTRANEKHQSDLEALRLRKEEESRIEIEAEKKKQAELAAAQKKWDANVTSMQMGLAQQSLGFIQSVSEEGSAIWVAATIAQKGMAITQAIINTELAATRALAELGPVAGPPMAATMRGLGYASVGLIAAQGIAELAGARERGGYVGYGRSYLVGEKGPEIFTAGAAGQITSNDNMLKAMAGRPAANQPIVFAPQISVEAGASQDADQEFAEEISDSIYSRIIEDIDTNGPIGQRIRA